LQFELCSLQLALNAVVSYHYLMPWTRLRIFLTSFAWAFGLFMGVLFGGLIRLDYGLPKPADLQEWKPITSTQLLDIRGNLIADFAQQRREPVLLDQIPSYIKDGIVAVEDKRFYHHPGIDFIRLFGMSFYNVRHLRIVQGGSTITQQLARNMFLNMQQTVDRKLKEALLAIEIERSFSKDEILEMYLNQVYFGAGAYGVEAAAQSFFGKDVKNLDLAQCATLSALPANATIYSPYEHPDNCMKRRNLFLKKLLALGKITEPEYDKALAEPIKVKPYQPRRNEAPYFVEEIRQYLEATYGPEFIYTGGATIYTTLDLRVQRAAEKALESHLAAIEKEHKLKHPKVEFDSLFKKDTTLKPDYLQGAVVAVDPKDGGIRAMVGGRNLTQSYFNRAVQAHRQAGSAFKVFVYTAAMDNGRTPNDIEDDSALRLQQPGSPVYEPHDIDYKYLGPISLYTALALSRNIVAVRLISEVGPEVVVSYARRMGIKSQLNPYYSLALGACDVTPLEMTSAFGVLDNGGTRVEPRYILKIVDPSGRIIEQSIPQSEPVLSEQTCRTMVYMMQGVVDQGTAYSIRSSGFERPAAGKTGTTDDYSDAWFVGFTPELACGVWVGYDTKRTIYHGATGGVVSAPIWAAVMSASPAPAVDDFFASEEAASAPAGIPDTGAMKVVPIPGIETTKAGPPTPAAPPRPVVPAPAPGEIQGY
jgi:penicillin-binding protein 1A